MFNFSNVFASGIVVCEPRDVEFYEKMRPGLNRTVTVNAIGKYLEDNNNVKAYHVCIGSYVFGDEKTRRGMEKIFGLESKLIKDSKHVLKDAGKEIQEQTMINKSSFTKREKEKRQSLKEKNLEK